MTLDLCSIAESFAKRHRLPLQGSGRSTLLAASRPHTTAGRELIYRAARRHCLVASPSGRIRTFGLAVTESLLNSRHRLSSKRGQLALTAAKNTEYERLQCVQTCRSGPCCLRQQRVGNRLLPCNKTASISRGR